MSKFTIYHNPRCSKSRQALALLEEKGAEFEIKEYLKESMSLTELKNLSKSLNKRPKEFMRLKEDALKPLDLDLENDEACLSAIIENPILLERPIVMSQDGRAVIGRPPENVLGLIS